MMVKLLMLVVAQALHNFITDAFKGGSNGVNVSVSMTFMQLHHTAQEIIVS